jgi:hypothetical protein
MCRSHHGATPRSGICGWGEADIRRNTFLVEPSRSRRQLRKRSGRPILAAASLLLTPSEKSSKVIEDSKSNNSTTVSRFARHSLIFPGGRLNSESGGRLLVAVHSCLTGSSVYSSSMCIRTSWKIAATRSSTSLFRAEFLCSQFRSVYSSPDRPRCASVPVRLQRDLFSSLVNLSLPAIHCALAGYPGSFDPAAQMPMAGPIPALVHALFIRT